MTQQTQKDDSHQSEQKTWLRLFYGEGAYLRRLRLQSLLTLSFERLWPRLLPVILLLALLASLSWFGLFTLMPRWLHIATLAIFAVALLAALYLLSRLRLPHQEEVTAHIEAVNALEHEPLAIQSGRMATGSNDPFALALWQEHQRRMAAQLNHLQSGLPRPNIPQHDPYAIRAVIALIFVTAFAYSYSPSSGRLSDALHIQPGQATKLARIDAWVTPPVYTGRPPIFLSTDAEAKAITVPQGSIVTIRANGSGSTRLMATDPTGHRSEIKPAKADETDIAPSQELVDGSKNFRFDLQQDTTLALSGSDTRWNFAVTPDKAPLIRFTKAPGQALNGTLQLAYEIEDDFGATKAYGEIIPLDIDDEEDALALYDAPDLALILPRRGTKEATTSKDLTQHPWSGGQVALTLVAVDAAGNIGRSETKTLTLPERPFTNPLSRAVAEQRRILALDAMQRDYVRDMLSSLMLRPDETIKNTAHFLGLATIQSRLRLSATYDELRDTADYMWQVALGIEDGNLSAAQKRLQQAQDALREALQNGASQEEIERLSAQLREAMQAFLREFAQRQQQNPNAKNMPMDPNARVMTDKDIQRMLDQIDNLARQGSRDQAEQLLSQLQDMLNNLQMGQQAQPGQQGQGQGQGQANQMQQQMNRLGELMRKQQQLMNDTFKLDQQKQQEFGTDQGEYNDDFFFNEDGSLQEGSPPSAQPQPQLPPEMAEQMRKLQQQQQKLQSELQQLNKALKGLGIDPNKDFSDAGKSMDSAADALGSHQGAEAGDHQGNALQALRRAGRDMMEQMQQAMGQGQGQEQGGSQEGRDPLGRQPGNSGPDFGNDVKIPGEIDIQRAREILDEIRRKLGDAFTPQMEKQYLERLLKFD